MKEWARAGNNNVLMNNQQEKNSREKRWLWLWRIENCKLTIKILLYLSLQASETKGTVRLVRGHRNEGPYLTDITLQSAPNLILSTLRRVDRRELTSTVTLSTLIPTNHGEYLQPATKLRQGNVFTPVCHSVHRGGWVSVPACTPGHMTGGGVLSGGSLTAGLCLGGLCPGRSLFRGLCPVHLCPGGSLSRRVSVQEGLYLEGYLSRGVSVWGVSSRGVSVRETAPYGNGRTARILLELILISELSLFSRTFAHISVHYSWRRLISY